MVETKFIWLNGKFVRWKEAKVHLLSNALHYGSGVFEGIRCYETTKGPAVFRLKEHLERLFYSAEVIKIKIPFSKKDLLKAILDLIKINKLKEGYIRPIVFYGYGKMSLNPLGAEINVGIAAWPWSKYLKETAKVKISKFIRLHPRSVISDAKVSGYYVNSILATLDAQLSGYDEAILLDYRGYIAEGAGENIFIVKDKVLLTPKLGSILPGITRKTVIEIAKDLKIKTKEKDISVKELLNADEVFFTGTAAEITPVVQINNKLINKGKEGEITKRIREFFNEIKLGKVKKYLKWLTFVNK